MLLHRIPDQLRVVQRVYDSRLRLRSHAHALPSMSIVLRGAVEESRGRRVETALPFSVSFMGADIAHDDAFGPGGAAMFQVHFEALDTIGEEQRTLLERWTWLRGGAVVRPFLRLVAAARSQRADDVEQMVADVIAAASDDAAPRGTAPRWLERARDAIDETNGWPRVAALANLVGVHRVQLARQFRRYYGCSVSAYVRRRRVQYAALAIETGGTIATAAHDAGFHDHSHLCHAFRAETSLSPSAFIAVADGAPSPVPAKKARRE
jgi:AraC family transcriptional regulator